MANTFITAKKFNRLTISFIDWSQAQDYAREAQSTDEGTYAYEALIQMAVICYWRPFSGNERRKSAKADRNLTLDDLCPVKLTQREHRLHKACERIRNKAIAHSEYRYNPT